MPVSDSYNVLPKSHGSVEYCEESQNQTRALAAPEYFRNRVASPEKQVCLGFVTVASHWHEELPIKQPSRKDLKERHLSYFSCHDVSESPVRNLRSQSTRLFLKSLCF